MPRVKNNVAPLFTLKVGAASAVDFGATDLVSVDFQDGDGNSVTFADYAGGGATQLVATYVINTDANSAWNYHWTNFAATGVTYAFQFTNAAVSATNSKYTGTLSMPGSKPKFSHEAGESTEQSTFEVTYQLDSYNKQDS